MSCWILLRLTHSSWIKSLSFAHWVCSTSMTHLHWPLKYAYAGMLLCSRWRRGIGWCKRGALRNGRFPVQALVMIDDARGGARRHDRFPPPAVNSLNIKRYLVEPMPYHDRVTELCLQLCLQLQIRKPLERLTVC